MRKGLVLALLTVALVLMGVSSAFAATGSAEFRSGYDVTKVYGPIGTYAAPEAAAWGTSWAPAVPVTGPWPIIPDCLYISNSIHSDSVIGIDQWRWYRITITLPSNAVNVQPSGSMIVNSDNADRTWINGRLAGTDGPMEGAAGGYEWKTAQTYALQPEDLHAGENYMDVVVRNYAWTTGGDANPTSFAYKFSATWTYDLTVDVDIKPGSDPSAVNWDGNGKVPIAILGSDIFDVHTINAATVAMNGAAVGVRGKKDPTVMASYTDVNFDGYEDLVVQIVDTDGNVIPAGATEVLVSGYLTDGTYFSGTGDIKLIQ